MLIGLAGEAGSGKSYAANRLIERHNFVCVKMADPLKNMLRALGLTDAHIEGALKETPCDILCGATPRHAMRTLGTEWGRDIIHQKLWTSLFAKTVRAVPATQHVVCDDVRFADEAAAIRAVGGHVVRIHAHAFELKQQPFDVHASERLDFVCEFYLINTFDPSFDATIDLLPEWYRDRNI